MVFIRDYGSDYEDNFAYVSYKIDITQIDVKNTFHNDATTRGLHAAIPSRYLKFKC